MFLADVVAVHTDEKYMDETQKFHLEQAESIMYSHGSYFGCGELLGTFGYSVRKKNLTFGTKSDIININIYLLRRSSIRQASGAFFMRKVWVSV